MCLFWTPAGVCRGDPQDNSWATATCVDFGRLRAGPTADEIRSVILNRCNAMQCNALRSGLLRSPSAGVGSSFTSTPKPNGHLADPCGGRRRARPIATSGNPDWASRGAHRQASAAVSHPPRDPMAILRIPVDCRPRTPSGLPADPFGKQRQRFHIHRTADGNPVGFLRIPSAGVGNCVTSTSRPNGQPANPRAGRRRARPIATHGSPQAVLRSLSAGVGSCLTSTPRPHGNPADPRGRRRRARPIVTHGNPVGFLRTLSAGVASCFTSTPRPN